MGIGSNKRVAAWLAAAILASATTPAALGGKPSKDPPASDPPVKYKMVEIGLNNGSSWNYSEGINNAGVVVGHGGVGPGWICSLDENGAPVLQYLPDHIIDIPGDGIEVDPSWSWGRASLYGINDAGQLCGKAYQIKDGVAARHRAFRFDPGFDKDGTPGYQPLVLGTLDPADDPESASLAYDINEAGDVTGISKRFAEDLYQHAFVWRNDTKVMTSVGDLGGFHSYGLAINNSVQVCGYADLPSDRGYKEHAFRHTPPNVLQDLGTIKSRRGNETSWGQDINDNGWIVGFWSLDAWNAFTFLDIPGVGMIDLGEHGGIGGRGINKHGDICGCGFLWTAEHLMIDLEATIEDLPEEYKGWLEISKINDYGWICGHLNENSGSTNPFVLIPTKSLPYWLD